MPQKIIFFDTETTGNTPNDFLCQLAYKSGEESFVSLYKPPVRIPPEASAVNHITNKMVEDKPYFRESAEFSQIKKMFESPGSMVVAHNAVFDLMILEKEGITPKNFICTLRVARHLDPEEKLSKYNLQYLRYALGIEVDARAHDAGGDVLVLEKLYERLKKKMEEKYALSPARALEKMTEISSRPSVLRSMGFGKYKGMKMEEVLETDRPYLEWLLGEKEKEDGKSGMEEDLVFTLRHFLKKE